MNKILAACIVTGFFPTALPQKPAVNFQICERWQLVSGPSAFIRPEEIKVSNNGKWICYGYQAPSSEPLVVIQRVDGSYRREVANCSLRECSFSSDSRYALYKFSSDQLGIFDLDKGEQRVIQEVASFVVTSEGDGQWACYQSKANRQLILLDLLSHKEKMLGLVTDYRINPQGTVLVVQRHPEPNSYRAEWIELPSGTSKTVYEGAEKTHALVFDPSGMRIAFSTHQKQLCLYEPNNGKAFVMLDGKSDVVPPCFDVSTRDFSFSHDGKRLYFMLEPKNDSGPQKAEKRVKVEISSTADDFLPYAYRPGRDPRLEAVFNLANRKAFVLRRANESREGDGDYAIVSTNNGSYMEGLWRPRSETSYFLVSTLDGSRKKLFQSGELTDCYVSPNSKYAIWFDREKKNYLAYDIAEAMTRNVTQKIKVPLYDDEWSYPRPAASIGSHLKLWQDNDKAFYIFDRYDLWQVDPAGKQAPVNITRGYGRKHRLIFNVASPTISHRGEAIDPEETMLLSAFDRTTKENGFYSVRLRGDQDPKKLIMGPYVYDISSSRGLASDDRAVPWGPIKVEGGYIVRRMSASEAPNYFFTKEFKAFVPLTNVYPEKAVNWLTTELVRWRTFNGTQCEGILYKPENFNPAKKYPVICTYYEKFSDTLNVFLSPYPSSGRLNIPYFVSHGYLVFVPDIDYKPGFTGESAYNCVVSGAKYLGQKPWVDAVRMGLQGHSFGGFQTNYIVTRTQMFAAACTMSGATDWSSRFGTVSYRDKSMVQFGQSRMGKTPWEAPEIYVRNSPVYHVDKIATPMLIVVGKQDTNVPPTQGIALFTNLRRANRTAWLLSYDNGSHELDPQDSNDFTVRMMQFFDHYLKGASMPDWMKGS